VPFTPPGVDCDVGNLAIDKLRGLTLKKPGMVNAVPLSACVAHAQAKEFGSIVAQLSPAEAPASLFAVIRGNEVFTTHAKQRTGEIGRRWRVYLIDEPLRPKVLRPASWIMKRHPDFVLRADFKGDLRASILASLAFDEGAGDSELALARASGGSRAQVRKALDNLEMTGRVRRHRAKSGTRIELVRFK